MQSLTLVGDTAWPRGCQLNIDDVLASLGSSKVVANLEGPIVSDDPISAPVHDKYKFNLYSDESFLRVAKSIGIAALGLANNHISDYHDGIRQTIQRLEAQGIKAFGLVKQPSCTVTCGGKEYTLIGACSPITDFRRSSGDHAVAEFKARELLGTIAAIRESQPHQKIIVYVHWGYELSRYPMPADREWARKAVDAGADYVIGHHPHVVQGVENYNNGILAYSLGNFLLPQERYRDRTLSYKDESVTLQLALSLEENVKSLWYEYDVNRSKICCLGASKCEQDSRIDERTPFCGMDDEEYARWYRSALVSKDVRTSFGTPTLWSYFGASRGATRAKTVFLSARQLVRKAAIAAGIHRPYNW